MSIHTISPPQPSDTLPSPNQDRAHQLRELIPMRKRSTLQHPLQQAPLLHVIGIRTRQDILEFVTHTGYLEVLCEISSGKRKGGMSLVNVRPKRYDTETHLG